MRYCILLICSFSFFYSHAQQSAKTQNIFIVTIDGIRWQEIFKGADPAIINSDHFTGDVELAKLMYLDSTELRSRKKLLPFFWNVIQQQGELYGNRLYGNKVNVANWYKFSYPGYNEIFTGYPDIHISSNEKYNNLNINVLEYLNSFDEFKDKVIAFTSWDVFPYIFNKDRSLLKINSGYDPVEENGDNDLHIFNKVQEISLNKKQLHARMRSLLLQHQNI